MRGEVVFVAVYALLLLAAAAGIARLGRVNSSAWSSRVLAGHRRQVGRRIADPEPADAGDWPHSEVPRFHVGMALVPVFAAAMLAAAELIRHHRPAEAVVLLVVLAVTARTGRVLQTRSGLLSGPS